MRLPETAIEAAAKALCLELFEGDEKIAAEDFEEHAGGYRDDAVAALTAFCESMGFEEDHTLRYEGWHKERPVTRLRSPWRPVEGEDPK